MAAIIEDESTRRRMNALGIRAEDLEENFIRGTGAGGQKINKTASTVVLRHVPSGIEVRCQQERSQSLNRVLARRELCDKLEGIFLQAKLERRQAVEKRNRQTRQRPRGMKEKMLEGKRRRAVVKKNRSGPLREE